MLRGFTDYVGYGGKNDISLSTADYFDLIGNLREDNLSKDISMKFKNASMCNHAKVINQLVFSILSGYFGGKYLSGPLNIYPANKKNMFGFAVAFF